MATGTAVKRKYVAEDILEATREVEKSDNQRSIEDYCRRLHLDNHQTHVVEKRMRLSIEHGLTKRRQSSSSVKCFPTYVRRLPTGEEKGRFLALDLGGTNFRVLQVELPGSRDQKPRIGPVRQSPVPKEVMASEGLELFDFIAGRVSDFVKEHGLEGQDLPVGFTFSFPCEQKGLDSATLKKWTKGFSCPAVVGKDVGQLLRDAMEKRGNLKSARLEALLNDSTGCLLSCAWGEPRCRVGLIVGTGCNACYLEHEGNADTWEGDGDDGEETMVVNTEWGAFGECGELDFIMTSWDQSVDNESINPGMHVYEKMISGMYMGDIVRHILKDLADKKLIFQDLNKEKLGQKGSVQTKHVCEVEQDPIGSFGRCRAALKVILGTEKEATDADCYAVRFICEEITRRACMLLGAGIAALLRKMDYKDVIIAVDGTLFRSHPLFYCMVKKKIAQLMGIDYKFDMVLSTDGSGVGAAVIAAVESQKAK